MPNKTISICFLLPIKTFAAGTHCLQPPLPNDTLGLKLYEWQRGEPVLIGDVRQNECYVCQNYLLMLHFDLQEVKYICRDGAALAGGQVHFFKKKVFKIFKSSFCVVIMLGLLHAQMRDGQLVRR